MTEERGTYNHRDQPEPDRVEQIGTILSRLVESQQWGPPLLPMPDPAARRAEVENSRRYG